MTILEEEESKYYYKRATIDLPTNRHLNGVSLACLWWPNFERWLGTIVIIGDPDQYF